MSEFKTSHGAMGAALWALALGAAVGPMAPMRRSRFNEPVEKPAKKKRKFKGSRAAKRSSRP